MRERALARQRFRWARAYRSGAPYAGWGNWQVKARMLALQGVKLKHANVSAMKAPPLVTHSRPEFANGQAGGLMHAD